ncbi:MAG: cyclic nucleotide-binding domain-containing protein [Candidatus Kryptoniota bacterium]
MQTQDLSVLLRKHPFIADLEEEFLKTLLGCASNALFHEGSYLFHEGEAASTFYLIRTGRVALELSAGQRGKIRIQTIGPGEVIGWSWLISPYRWHFDGYAVEDVHTFAIDATCLRTKCENDHHFGYEMLKRFSEVLEQRLNATRLQLLDIYSISAK